MCSKYLQYLELPHWHKGNPTNVWNNPQYHDDVMKWKHFPHYWPFERGIHWPPLNGEFPALKPVTRNFDVSFDLSLNKRLSKQSWGWWFETPSRSLWRHRNDEQNNKYLTTRKRQTIANRRHIDGLMPKRRNSIAKALELRLSCNNPSICFSSWCNAWNMQNLSWLL